jgi:hypothetical protein
MGVLVMDPLSSFTQRFGPITPLAAYDPTTSITIDVRAQRDKVLLIKNTGGAALTFTILASIDSPKEEDGYTPEFDIVHLGDTVVAPAGQSLQAFTNYYSMVQIQVKGVGSIAVIKAAGFGN